MVNGDCGGSCPVYSWDVSRALAVIACLVTLSIAAAMLVGLWRIGSEVKQREMSILAGELQLALSRAAGTHPVDFDLLHELRGHLLAGDEANLQSRLEAALPDYSNLEQQLQQLLHERHPQLDSRAIAMVGRVTLMDKKLGDGMLLPLGGATTSLSGSVTARHALFLEAGGFNLEVLFEAAFVNVEAELGPRLLPLRLGAIVLALLLVISSIVTLRAIVYSRTIGAYQSELIDTLAHELHTPLTTLHIGLRTLTDSLDEAGIDVVERLQRQVRRLQRLTERVTVTSRALLHDAAPNLALRQPDAEIRSLLTERFPEPLSAGTLQLQLNAPNAQILADQTDLEVLVGNLVENALKFTTGPNRHQKLPAHTLVSTIRLQKLLMIRVDDNGPGITRKIAQHFSHPFRRGTQAASGLGLGLYLCRRIVRRMGGRITIGKSQLGGVSAQIMIPLFRKEDG